MIFLCIVISPGILMKTSHPKRFPLPLCVSVLRSLLWLGFEGWDQNSPRHSQKERSECQQQGWNQGSGWWLVRCVYRRQSANENRSTVWHGQSGTEPWGVQHCCHRKELLRVGEEGRTRGRGLRKVEPNIEKNNAVVQIEMQPQCSDRTC